MLPRGEGGTRLRRYRSDPSDPSDDLLVSASVQRLEKNPEPLRQLLLEAPVLPALIGDLAAVLLVRREGRLHLRREVAVIEGEAVFLVGAQGAAVEVDRSDDAEEAVDHRVLLMHHRVVVFEDVDSRLKKVAVVRAR